MINQGEIFRLLPGKVISLISSIGNQEKIQEIRMRVNRPTIIETDDKEHISSFVSSREDLNSVVQKISNYSMYAFEEDIRQGFITFKGGHRIGISGECVMDDKKVKTIKNISSLNIRISKEFIGCSNMILPFVQRGNKIMNTIIISPPKCGKTTLLRDLTRNLSNGYKNNGKKISLIDERSEIAGCSMGIPQMDIGSRTDVFDNCIKSQGIMMAIRSMSPEVIVCDEIGTQRDTESIMMAYNCGVNLICSLHGESLNDYKERLVFHELVTNNIFKIAVLLFNRKKPGKISEIYDLSKECILWRDNND